MGRIIQFSVVFSFIFLFVLAGCTKYGYPGLDDYQNETIQCSDSDNGKDYYKRGVGKGYYNGKFSRIVETCVSDPENKMTVQESPYLGEVFCTADNRLEIEIYECRGGCANGVCVKETPNSTCPDSDNC